MTLDNIISTCTSYWQHLSWKWLRTKTSYKFALFLLWQQWVPETKISSLRNVHDLISANNNSLFEKWNTSFRIRAAKQNISAQEIRFVDRIIFLNNCTFSLRPDDKRDPFRCSFARMLQLSRNTPSAPFIGTEV